MATIAVTELVPNANIVQPTPSAMTATNIISTQDTPLEEIVLQIVVATAPTTVTVKGGDNPPALAAGQGDLVLTSLAVGTHFVGPFTSARFIQSDGTLNVDSATSANTTLSALHMPRTA
jgi:hypothetical protein